MGKICRLLVLFLSSFFFLASSSAQEKIVEGGKTFYLHKVKKGEGFYRLSVIYQVAQKEIIDANPDLAFQGLKEGSLVKVPAKSTSSALKGENQVNFSTYTVKKGQTLYSLSRDFDVSVDQLVALNPGIDKNLPEGAVIKLPIGTKKSESSTVSNQQNGDFSIHTVTAGETLFGIAQKYQLSTGDLYTANPALTEHSLSIGERIRIPRKVNGQVSQSVDDMFLIHTVVSGETLFGISQKYGRHPIEIKLANDELVKGEIYQGQLLRIPRQPLNLMLDKNALFLTHNVSRKETLYGIGRNYETDVEVIKLVNPNLDFAALKKGVEIRIPRSSWYKEIVKKSGAATDDAIQDKLTSTVQPVSPRGDYENGTRGQSINVALLMPFDYAGHVLIRQTPDSLRTDVHRTIAARSKNYLEFYEGALLAIDSLKRGGTSVNLFVYDTRRDSVNFSKFLQRGELSKMNLIIGPANIDHMKTVAAYAQDKQIPVVFPFAVMDGSIRNNPYLYQASPIDSLYRRAAVEAQLKFAAGKKVVVLTTGSSHPYELAVISHIKQYIQDHGSNPNVVFHRYAQRDVGAIRELLDADQETTIIIASIEELKVSRMLANLGLMVDRSKVSVTVLGFSDWFKFQTVEAEDLHKLNTTIFSPYGADYGNPECLNFSHAYRHWFQSEPVSFNPYFQQLGSNLGYSRFGMWGYDVTFYFVGAIKKYGQQFDKSLPDYRPKLIQSNFRFTHFSNWGGAYNSGLMKVVFSRDFKTQVNVAE